MIRHRRLLTSLAVLLGCCTLYGPPTALGQNIQQAVVTSPPRHGSSNLFAVMGHVRDPQVFELATASPSLVELLDVFARGLTDTASSNVRIIRKGRAINTFYRKDSTERLMPGDLVIVDGRSSRGTIYRGGQSNAASAAGRVRIGVLGVLPYPLLIQLNAGESASARSIAESLGQSELAATQAQFIVPRRFSRTDATTLLPDGSVIIFDPSTIDISRLPPTLPSPVRPSQAAPPTSPQDAATGRPPLTGQIGAPRPLAQIPYARSLSAPGMADGPNSSARQTPIPPSSQPTLNRTLREPSNSDQPLRRDAEERVRDLLTSPSSVPVESAGNPISTAPAPPAGDGPGRVSLNDKVANTTSDSAARQKPTRAASPDKTSTQQATKPFQSFVDQHAETDADSEKPGRVELPLTPTEPSADDRSAQAPGNVPNEFPVADGAVQDRDENAAVASRSFVISNDRDMSFPTAVKSATALESQSAPRPQSDSATLAPVKAAKGLAVRSSSSHQPSRLLDAVQKGTVSPKPLRPANWPLISALAIGGGSALSILLMMVLVAWRKPEPPTPIEPGSRYWLDRLIQNELTIVDEAVELPNGEHLFGKATPIRRVDAAHRPVPKPHFLAISGVSDVGLGSTPPSAEAESGETDSQTDVTRTSPANRRTKPGSRSNLSQPAVPLPPTAERSPLVTSGSSTADSSPADRNCSIGFSLDLTRLPPSARKSGATTRLSTPNETATSVVREATSRKTRQMPPASGDGTGLSFRVDDGHRAAARPTASVDSLEQAATGGQPPATKASQPHSSATQQPTTSHSDNASASDSIEPPVSPSRMPVPRPRHLARRYTSTANERPASSVEPVAEPERGAIPTEVSASTTPSVLEPPADIAVKPARSVAETADLLDRVLSSVQRERRGGQ